MRRQISGLASASASKLARLTNTTFDSRIAIIEADRGSPSIIDNSPKIDPGPKMPRIRSAPEADTTAAFNKPLSTR